MLLKITAKMKLSILLHQLAISSSSSRNPRLLQTHLVELLQCWCLALNSVVGYFITKVGS